jgi:hypothetical protein
MTSKSAKSPRLLASIVCPGGQGDVSIYGNLLFMSVEQTRGRVDCGLQGVAEAISKDRFRGVRIFDITDIRNPKQVAAVQTCRGSHTHTLVPKDKQTLYVYGSGTGGVRSVKSSSTARPAIRRTIPNTGALQHRRHRSAARRAREGARRQPAAHLRRREERQRSRASGPAAITVPARSAPARPTSATTSRCIRRSASPRAPARATAS